MQRRDLGRRVVASQRGPDLCQRVGTCATKQSGASSNADLVGLAGLGQELVNRLRLRWLALGEQVLCAAQESFKDGRAHVGRNGIPRSAKRGQGSRRGNTPQRAGGGVGDRRVGIGQQRLEQRHRPFIPFPAKRIRDARLEQTGGLAQRFTEGRAGFGRRNAFQREPRGLRDAVVGQLRGDRRHGFRGADQAQLLAGGAFLHRRGTGLERGNQFGLGLGACRRANQRQQEGEQQSFREVRLHGFGRRRTVWLSAFRLATAGAGCRTAAGLPRHRR